MNKIENTIFAITPIDGRYREKVEELSPYTSEAALIKARTEIEAKYLVALSDVGQIRPISENERQFLTELGSNIDESQILRVKELESVTNHDVKAVEYFLRETFEFTSLNDLTNFIHFGLTSEDINNLAIRLMLKRATHEVCVPALDLVIDALVEKANEYKFLPMLGRTHGQSAVGTTLGKEFANFAFRLNKQVRKLEGLQLEGKLNGAVGNYNAQVVASPEIDWLEFSERFVKSLGLEWNLATTQIDPYEDVIEILQCYQRINAVIGDFDQNMWLYIMLDYFTQQPKAGEIGSSTMPQKINPINFENSEGSADMANGYWDVLVRTLPYSRLQRDLTDSTKVRHIGSALALGLLMYKGTLEGLSRVAINTKQLSSDLNNNWAILAEAAQTLLRKADVPDAYKLLERVTKGKKLSQKDWVAWVEGLEIDKDIKARLRGLSPEKYIGNAPKITEMVIERINRSRQHLYQNG